VTPPDRDYTQSTPIIKNIEKINDLYDAGHTIVYWTARGSGSGKDHTELTKHQMEKWKAKFHELKLGKPVYDLFICDKAVGSRDYFN
jgi:cobalamin biosynthesis Co2+ chelatase CbiK